MNIDELLMKIIDEQSTSNDVAVLLSAGTDSISCAVAAHRLGKKITAYSMFVNGIETTDSKNARDISKHFGWDFVPVDVPVDNIERDFFTLIRDYNCKKKTQVECTFPFLYVYPLIKQKDLLSGIAADGHYGSSKKACIHFKEPKELFDRFRCDYFNAENPAGIIQQRQLATEYGINFIAPYLENEVKSFYLQFDWYELNKPIPKKIVHDAFPEFEHIRRRKHENLQLVANIPFYFEKLLDNKTINYKNRKRIMDLVRDYQ